MSSIDCEFRNGDQCQLATDLAGMDVPVADDACRACLDSNLPRQINYVVASIAYRTVSASDRPCYQKLDEIQDFATLGRPVPQVASDGPKKAKREKPMVVSSKPSGPGTELKKMFSLLGIKDKPGCACNRHAKKMDIEGADWCDKNVDRIVGWLAYEARRRRFPFSKMIARRVVKLAIRRSRKSAKNA